MKYEKSALYQGAKFVCEGVPDAVQLLVWLIAGVAWLVHFFYS